MKKLALAALAALLAGCKGPPVANTGPQDSPRTVLDLTFNRQTVNLGTIPVGETKTETVQVQNPNPFPIKILSVSTSCGCTEASIDAQKESIPLPANSLKTIKIKFDSEMHQPGDNFHHEIYLLTDQPLDQEYVIKIEGKIG